MSDSLVTLSLRNFVGKRGCYFSNGLQVKPVFFFRKTIKVISASHPIGLTVSRGVAHVQPCLVN